MKSHTFDPVSFVFGVIAAVIAVSSVAGWLPRYGSTFLVIPALLAVVGSIVIASAISSLQRK